MSSFEDNNTVYEEVNPVFKDQYNFEKNLSYDNPMQAIGENESNERSSSAEKSSSKSFVISLTVTVTLAVLVLCAVAAVTVFVYFEISKLKSKMVSLDQISSLQDNASLQLNASIDMLYQRLTDDYTSNIHLVLNSTAERLMDLENITETNAFIQMVLTQGNSVIDTRIKQLQNSTSERIENFSQQINASLDLLFQQLTQDYAALDTKIQALRNSSDTTLERLVNSETTALQTNASIDILYQKLARDYSALDTGIQQIVLNSNNSYQHLSERLLALEDRLFNLSGQCRFNPVPSCAALPPSSPSGYYWITASNGSAVHVYCDMTRSCGNITGGWMRVAELDMTNSSHQCPNGLTQPHYTNVSTCVRNSSSAGCSSVMVPTSNVNYTYVCGRVLAYQHGSTDAFFRNPDINSYYVDGVSLTYGSPREHIWTFVAALDEVTHNNPAASCPCIRNDVVDSETAEIPSFVGDDYFCDTGSQDRYQSNVFFGDDPLWDGAGCGALSTCCSFNTPPWFYRQLPQPTTDDIEMRVCRDQNYSNEDIAIEVVDIYVR